MANSIDKRIVEMQFDNSRFERNVNQSISTLDRLKESLNFSGSAKGFEDLERSANKINFSGLEKSISNIEHRFSTLGIVGATVVSNLTTKVMSAVGKLNNALFGQMKSGGISRALNLEHANFMLQGILKDANKVAELMGSDGPVQKSVKGTAYGLDAAANAAAQFVASGIKDAKQLETALTGISGAAAISGSSYEDISRIFTKVAASGRMMGDTVVELSTRGINALATLSEQLDIPVEKLQEMQKKGQISFEMFSEAMNKAFGEQAKKANETFTGALSNVKAALSRIGAKVATPGIENLRVIFVKLIDVIDNTSKTLQPLIDFINNAFFSISEAIATFLGKTGDIDKIVSNIVETIGNGIKFIYSFILPIKRALEDLVPPKTVNDAITLTEKIKEFTNTLILTADQMVTVRRIFRGVFSVFDIAIQLISALIRILFPAADGIKSFIGGFANGAATISDYIYAISLVLKKTDAFYQFFNKIKNYIVDGLAYITDKLGIFKGMFGSLGNIKFSGGSILEKIKSMVDTFKKDAAPIKTFGDIFVAVFSGIGNVISTISPLLGAFAGMVGRACGELADGFEKAFNGGGFRTLMALVTGGLLASIAVSIANFIKNIIGTVNKGVSFLSSIKGVINEVKNTLEAVQVKLKSEALLNLAKAIGILAASIAVLAMLDTGKCAAAMAMITIIVAELIGLTYLIEKFTDTWKKSGSLIAAGTMFIELTASIVILGIAMKQIASIPADRLMDSLGAVSALLAELVIVTLVLSTTEAKIKTGALSLIELAVAVRVLASAVDAFGSMDSNKLIQGLLGVTAALVGLAAAAAAMGKTDFGFFDGTAILLMAAALNIVATAVDRIGSLSVDTLSHGLIAIGAALAEIAVFMTVMGDAQNLLGTAAAIGILALALQGIATALQSIGTLDPLQLTAALVGMGVALAEMGIALTVLSENALGAIGAAAAIAILAISLNALIPVLSFFRDMDIGQLVMSLGGLAGALTVLGVAAAIFGAGSELILIGAAAIAAVSAACLIGAVAIAATAAAIEFMADAFERLATVSWGDMLGGLGKLVVVFTALGVMGILIAPLAVTMTILATAMGVMALACIGLSASITIAAFGISMLAAAVQEFANINPETIAKAIDTLRQVIVGLVDACWLLAPVSPVIVLIGVGILALGAGALMAASSLIIFAEAFTQLGPIIQEVYPVLEQFVTYLVNNFDNILVLLYNLLIEISAMLLKGVTEIFAALLKLIVDGFQNMVNTIIDWSAKLLKALGVPSDWVDAAANLVKGFVQGIVDNAKSAIDAVKQLGQDVIDGLKDILQIHSPSEATDEIGQLFDEGLGNGVSKLGDWVVDQVAEVGKGMIEQAKSDANKVADVWEATIKYYGRSLEFDVGLKNGDIKSIAGVGYVNTKTNEIKNLISGNGGRDTINSITQDRVNSLNKESKAMGGNSKAAKANTKAKEENEEANDGKTGAIDEETESLGEETEATNENEEAIRAMAEEIEVVTEKYKELNAWTGWKNKFKNVGKQFVAMGNAWSKSYKDIETKANGTKNVLNHTAKEISYYFNTAKKDVAMTTDSIAKGLYAFDMETGKYDKKMTKRLKKASKSVKSISKTVQDTGKMIIKTYEGYAKVYTKAGGGKTDKMVIRLTKNVKNLGSYAKKAASFVQNFNNDVKGAQYVEDFTDNLRNIENFFVKRQNMPKKVQNYLGDILSYFNKDFKDSMNILAKNIDGIGDYWKKGTQSTAYVADSFVQLAATLYDGSEAANQYWTEIARLQFLVEQGLESPEVLEEAYVGYLERAVEALKEYKAQLEETISGQFNPFEEFDKKMEDQTKDLLKCLESQIAGFNDWGDMLNSLAARGANFNLTKDLADKGVESYGIVKNLLSMTASELALYNKYYMMIDSVKQKASDAALAAVANARTQASLRAAAKSGKLTEKQMNQQRNLAKRMKEDIKSVANAQAWYNKLTKRQEKEYVASLNKQEKAAYKKAKKDAKRAKKEQEALAAAEEAKRKEESRVDAIMETVTGYETLIKVMDEYVNDANVMNKINEKLDDSFSGIYKNLGKSANVTKAWLKFANQLGAEGEDAESYFSSLKSTIESFRDGIKNALYDISKTFTEFKEATEKISTEKMFSNAISQARASRLFGAYIERMANMGYNSQVIEYIGKKFSSDQAAALAEMKDMVNATRQTITNLNDSFKAYSDAMEKSMKQADQAVVRSQQDPALEAFQAAEARYNEAQARLKTLTSDEESMMRIESQFFRSHAGNLEKIYDLASEMLWSNDDRSRQSARRRVIEQFKNDLEKLRSMENVSAKAKVEYAKRLAERYKLDELVNTREAETLRSNMEKIQQKIDQAERRGYPEVAEHFRKQLAELQEEYKNFTVEGLIDDMTELYNAEYEAAKAEAEAAVAAYQQASAAWQAEQAIRAQLVQERALQEAFENALIELSLGIEKYEDLISAISKAGWNADYLTRTYRKLKTALEPVNRALTYAKNRFKEFNGTSKSVLSELSMIEEGFYRLASALDATNDESGTLIENLGARLEDYRKQLYDALSGQSQLFEEFKKYSGEEPTSANKYLNNMASQIEALESWLDNLEYLSERGVSGDILRLFVDEGLGSYEKVLAFVKATDEQLGDLIYQYRKYMDLMEGTNGETAAADRALALIANSYTDKAMSLADQLVKAFTDSGMERVKDVAENTAIMVIEGIKDGLTHAMPTIQNAVNESTSVTTMAERIGESVATGINNGLIQAVSTSVEDTVRAAVEKFKMAVDEINQYVQENLQSEYTITVHVNMSEIDQAVARFNSSVHDINIGAGATSQAVQSSMANNAAVVAPTAPTTQTSSPINLSYTQNNYSPKALSRPEIYRQTRNQLSTIEGVVSSATGG